MSFVEARRGATVAMLLACLGCAAPRAEVVETTPLGLNDVSLLLPLPASPEGPPTLRRLADDRASLLSRALFERLVSEHGDVLERYESFHVVAVRFDLCDRQDPGDCPLDADGRVRLVLQPLLATQSGSTAADVALHAFYPIPARELGSVVNELRGLARLSGVAADAPMAVNAPLGAPLEHREYQERLRALVERFAVAEQLFRLTLFAQTQSADGFSWVFRGLVKDGAGYSDIRIAGLGAVEQRVTLFDTSRYVVRQTADMPVGFSLALDPAAFGAASEAEQRRALEALAAVNNPSLHTAETVPCAACHLATIVAAARRRETGLDDQAARTRFSSAYPLSVDAGAAEQNAHALRGFGWLLREPMISRRVVHDSALAVAEMEVRWPVR